MKRYLTIILLSILPYTVWCDNVSEGVMDNIRYMINYDTQEAFVIRNGNLYSGNIIIPEKVWDIYTVVGIGGRYSECLFDYYTTEVDIPASVRTIKYNVFNGCYNLKKVNIHDLESWMSCTFNSNPLEYGADLFLNGEKVTKVVVPRNFKMKNKFYGCNSIDSVEIHDSVSCTGFSGLENLRHVSISDGCTFPGGSAFSYCPLLTSAGPKGSGCAIEYDFKNIIPKNFLDANNNLKELRIPSNIVKIENYAFNTERLENIYIEAEVPPTVNEEPFL